MGSKREDRLIEETLGFCRWMRDDPYVAGEARLAAANIGAERVARKKRLEGKQQLKRQMELLMFVAAGDTELKDEMPGNEPCWTKHMQSMFPDYYQ